MMSSGGVPARNSFVQNERRQVWEVIQAYLGLVVTISWLPFLWEAFIGVLMPASCPTFLIYRFSSSLVVLGTCLLKRLIRMSWASARSGMTTQWSDLLCFL